MWMGLLTAAVLWPAMQVPTMATAALRGMGERAAVWSAFSGGNEGSNASDVRAALMAVGDLHGDLQQAVAALRLAGAMGSDGRWAGGRGTLVQTGDALDRGNDSLAVLGLLARLQEEAASAGGEVVLLAGNHELMNLAGDLRYVAPGELAWLSRNVTDATSAGTTEDAYDPMDVRRGLALWRRAIAPDAPAGIALRSRRVVAIAGRGACRTLFVHAGLTEPVLRQAAELGTSLHQPAGNGSLAAAADAALSGALRTCFTDGDPEGGSDGGADMYGPRKRWKACPGGSVENTEALTILQSAVGPLWLRCTTVYVHSAIVYTPACSFVNINSVLAARVTDISKGISVSAHLTTTACESVRLVTADQELCGGVDGGDLRCTGNNDRRQHERILLMRRTSEFKLKF